MIALKPAIFAFFTLRRVSAFKHDRKDIQYSNATATADFTSLITPQTSSSSSYPSTILPSAAITTGPSSTSSLSSTITTSNTTTAIDPSVIPAPNGTLDFCCSQLYQGMIGLVFWYTGPAYNVTVATVISIYAQYNNTKVLETVSTINVPNATALYGTYDIATQTSTTVISGLPNTLVPGVNYLYGKTVIGGDTVMSFPSGTTSLTVSSPTPFWYYSDIPFVTGVSSLGDTGTLCSTLTTASPGDVITVATGSIITATASPGNVISVATDSIITATASSTYYVAVDVPPVVDFVGESNFDLKGPIVEPYTGNLSEWLCEDCASQTNFDIILSQPKGLIEYLANMPFAVSQLPQIGSCMSMGGGEGAPTVHVPVSELTHSTESVVTKTGVYTTKSSTDITPAPTPTTSQDESTASWASSAEVLLPGSQLTDPATSSSSEPPGTYTAEALQPAPHLTTSTTSETPGAATPELLTPEPTLVSSTTSNFPVAATAHIETTAGQLNDPSTSEGGIAVVVTTPMTSPSTSSSMSWVSTIAIQPNPLTSQSSDIFPALTLESTTASPDSSSQYNLGSGQTLSPNGPAVTHAGATLSISAGPSGTVFISNGISSTITPPGSESAASSPAAPVITFGTATLTQNFASQYILPAFLAAGSSSSDRTLSAGGPAVTGNSGNAYSIASDGNAVVINGQTSSIITPAAAIVTLSPSQNSDADEQGGIVASPLGSSGVYVIAGQTLSPGGSAIIASGTTISLAGGSTAGSAAVVVVDGISSTLSGTGTTPLTIGQAAAGILATPAGSSGELILAGQTLSPGGSAIVVSGTKYSLGASTSASPAVVVVNGATSTLSDTGPGPFTIGQVATVSQVGVLATPVGSSGEYVVAGQTLSPGGSAAVIDGTTYSLAPTGTAAGAAGEAVVINGVTSPLPTANPTIVTNGAAAVGNEGSGGESGQVVTIGSSTFPISQTIVAGTTEVIVGSQTLTPGGTVVVAGSTLSLVPEGTAVLVAGASESGGIAAAIMSVLGQEASSVSATTTKSAKSSGFTSSTSTGVSANELPSSPGGVGIAATSTSSALGVVGAGGGKSGMGVVSQGGLVGFVVAVLALL